MSMNLKFQSEDDFVAKFHEIYKNAVLPKIEDKRSYFVSITQLGIEKVDKICTYHLSPIYELRKNLGDKEFFKLMSYIENANEKMNKYKEESV